MNTLPFTKNSLPIRNNFPYDDPQRGKNRHTDSIYKYNNMGYRSNDDFIENDSSKKIMFFGCSITEGIGVEYEKTWPVIVSREFSKQIGEEYKNYNLSYAGCSSEHVSRMLYQTIDLYNPDLVLILWPSLDRREYFINMTDFRCVSENQHVTESKMLMLNELRNEAEDFYNFLKQLIFVESILENRNIKRIYVPRSKHFLIPGKTKEYINQLYWMDYDIINTWIHKQKALDNIHPGELAHKLFSDLILKKIKQTYTFHQT